VIKEEETAQEIGNQERFFKGKKRILSGKTQQNKATSKKLLQKTTRKGRERRLPQLLRQERTRGRSCRRGSVSERIPGRKTKKKKARKTSCEEKER